MNRTNLVAELYMGLEILWAREGITVHMNGPVLGIGLYTKLYTFRAYFVRSFQSKFQICTNFWITAESCSGPQKWRATPVHISGWAWVFHWGLNIWFGPEMNWCTLRLYVQSWVTWRWAHLATGTEVGQVERTGLVARFMCPCVDWAFWLLV